MAEIAPLPTYGTVFFDQRDPSRSLRLSWHPEIAAFVVSIWRNNSCVATHHLPAGDAVDVVTVLAQGLADGATGTFRGETSTAS